MDRAVDSARFPFVGLADVNQLDLGETVVDVADVGEVAHV
jgi:hypothetical protein